MKQASILFLLSLLLAFTAPLKGQTTDPFPTLPLAPNRSPVFGKDVVMYDQPNDNQMLVSVCSAFNGWLFAAIMHRTTETRLCQLKSEDNGITWEVLNDEMCYAYSITSLDVIACGTDLNNLMLYTAFSSADINGAYPRGTIYRDKAEPFELGPIIFDQSEVTGLSIAHDGGMRQDTTQPYSIGILFTKGTSFHKIYFRTSTDEGESFTQKLVSSGNFYSRKVSLSYGYSPSKNSGRYYAVWEERENFYSVAHNLFTAHTEPDFLASFTTPKCLDSLDPGLIYNCRYPVISCQSGNHDNDSLDITSVILFEKKDTATGKYDVGGFYNLQSTSSDHYQPLSFTNPSHENLQPDIEFNQADSKFLVTYYDATLKKLPSLLHDMNMLNPDDWQVVSTGYNDAANLSSPHPRVSYNPYNQSGINVWISQLSNGSGSALFDAQNSTYTAIQGKDPADDPLTYLVYPNPSNGPVIFHFTVKDPAVVTITLYTTLGQPIRTILNKTMSAGAHDIATDLSSLQPGCYFIDFKCNASSSRKILTLHR